MNVLKNILRSIDIAPVTGSQPPTPPGSVVPAGTEQSLERLTEEIRRLACRLTAQEWRFDEFAAAIGALEARHDQTQGVLDEIRTAVEPARLAALGGWSSDEITRRVQHLAVVARTRRAVRERLPKEARVLVIGRGDEDLLQFSGRRASHFPQDAAGDFAEEYRGSGGEVVDQLRDLVGLNWSHLVIPAPSFWWLERYRELWLHLHRDWYAVHRDDACMIFAHDLGRPGPWRRLDELVARIHTAEGRLPAILDWNTGGDVAAFYPSCTVSGPFEQGLDRLPHPDRTIDVVAVPWNKPEFLPEARRVASSAVVRIASPGSREAGFFVAVEAIAGCGSESAASPAPASPDSGSGHATDRKP